MTVLKLSPCKFVFGSKELFFKFIRHLASKKKSERGCCNYKLFQDRTFFFGGGGAERNNFSYFLSRL